MLLPVSGGNQWEVNGYQSSCLSLSQKSAQDFSWLFIALAVHTLSLTLKKRPVPHHYYNHSTLNAFTGTISFLSCQKAVAASGRGDGQYPLALRLQGQAVTLRKDCGVKAILQAPFQSHTISF